MEQKENIVQTYPAVVVSTADLVRGPGRRQICDG